MASEQTISATQFKAQCLGLIDQVARTGRELVITKHKQRLVRVVPAEPAVSLRGSVRYLVDDDELISPLSEHWDANE
jgi:prevent-host-death family protein